MTIALIVGSSAGTLVGARPATSGSPVSFEGASEAFRPRRRRANRFPTHERVLVLRADYAYDLPTLTGLLGQRRAVDGRLRCRRQPMSTGALAATAVDIVRDSRCASDPARAMPAIDVRATSMRSRRTCARPSRRCSSPSPPPPPTRWKTVCTESPTRASRTSSPSGGGRCRPRPWCASVPMPAITPNAVTCIGFALMLATCWLFYEGFHFWGLVLGWFMTYLDTVDGKLARVTVAIVQIRTLARPRHGYPAPAVLVLAVGAVAHRVRTPARLRLRGPDDLHRGRLWRRAPHRRCISRARDPSASSPGARSMPGSGCSPPAATPASCC